MGWADGGGASGSGAVSSGVRGGRGAVSITILPLKTGFSAIGSMACSQLRWVCQ